MQVSWLSYSKQKKRKRNIQKFLQQKFQTHRYPPSILLLIVQKHSYLIFQLYSNLHWKNIKKKNRRARNSKIKQRNNSYVMAPDQASNSSMRNNGRKIHVRTHGDQVSATRLRKGTSSFDPFHSAHVQLHLSRRWSHATSPLLSSVSTLTRKRMAIATWMTPMHTEATSREGTSGYNNT